MEGEPPVKIFVRGRDDNGRYQYFIVIVNAETHEELARGRLVAADYDFTTPHAWTDLLKRLKEDR